MRAWDIAAFVGAGIGAIFIAGALFSEQSAIQQAVAGMIGIGIAVIPYIISATLHRVRAERHREALELSNRAP